jgi:hypothetical protein
VLELELAAVLDEEVVVVVVDDDDDDDGPPLLLDEAVVVVELAVVVVELELAVVVGPLDELGPLVVVVLLLLELPEPPAPPAPIGTGVPPGSQNEGSAPPAEHAWSAAAPTSPTTGRYTKAALARERRGLDDFDRSEVGTTASVSGRQGRRRARHFRTGPDGFSAGSPDLHTNRPSPGRGARRERAEASLPRYHDPRTPSRASCDRAGVPRAAQIGSDTARPGRAHRVRALLRVASGA